MIETAQPRALEINGYTPERWAEEGRTWAEVWAEVAPLLWGSRLAGHNTPFDYSHIVHQCSREGSIMPRVVPPHLDTLTIARRLVRSDNYSLSALCTRFGISNEGAHGARADARRAFELYGRLV